MRMYRTIGKEAAIKMDFPSQGDAEISMNRLSFSSFRFTYMYILRTYNNTNNVITLLYQINCGIDNIDSIIIKVNQSHEMLNATQYTNAFYRLTIIEGDLDNDGSEEHWRQQQHRDLYQQPELIWWEEVDREFPLDFSTDMSEADKEEARSTKSVSESDLEPEDVRRQAEHLEIYGEVRQTPNSRKGRSPDTHPEQGDKSKNKRRRSAGSRDPKKQRKQRDPRDKSESQRETGQTGKPGQKDTGSTQRDGQNGNQSKQNQSGQPQDQVQARLRRLREREAREKDSGTQKATPNNKCQRGQQGERGGKAAARGKPSNTTLRTRPTEGEANNTNGNDGTEISGGDDLISAYNPTTEYMRNELNRAPSPFARMPDQAQTNTPMRPAAPAVEYTAQGEDREAYRRRLEENNPVSVPEAKKTVKERVPPERTFELTRMDSTPLHDDWLIPAELLSKARRAEDKIRRSHGKQRLKLDSRKLRTGDWIVMAMNDDTKSWLSELFCTEDFDGKFRITLVSEHADIKYALKVHPPDSKEDNELLLTHLFQDLPDLGYVRIINDSRNYRDRDGETNKAYHKSLKKRVPFDDKGVPYIKTIWIRMSQEAHDYITEHWDDLDFGYGAVEMELERVKEKKKKQKKKSQGDASQEGKENDQGNENGNESGSSDEEMVHVVEQGSGTVDESEGDQPENAVGKNQGE